MKEVRVYFESSDYGGAYIRVRFANGCFVRIYSSIIQGYLSSVISMLPVQGLADLTGSLLVFSGIS